MVTLTVLALPEGAAHAIRCGPAASSSPPSGVFPRATPSTETAQLPGLATMASRPLPMVLLVGVARRGGERGEGDAGEGGGGGRGGGGVVLRRDAAAGHRRHDARPGGGRRV